MHIVIKQSKGYLNNITFYVNAILRKITKITNIKMRLNTKVGLMSVFGTGTKQITNPYKYSVHLSIIYNLSVKYYSSK